MQQNESFEIKLGDCEALPGYLQGLAQTCARVVLHFQPAPKRSQPAAANFNSSLLMPLPLNRAPRLSLALANNIALRNQAQDVLACHEAFNNVLVRLQESAGCPVCSGAVVEHLAHSKNLIGGWSALVIMPSLNPLALLKILPFALAQFNGHIVGPFADKSPHTLAAVLKLLADTAPRGTNTVLFLAAAYALGVPVQRLAGQVFQYGWGAQARWMDSSFTDAASGIAARLARNKVAAHNLLARAGLPVAQQVRVRDVEVALQQAQRIGYPVVIKPADLDGGKGVEAGIGSAAVLKAAFARASRYSKNLILEQHIQGHDYRLGILYGQLSWVTYREPACVWGDGCSTIQALIKRANQDPRRGTNSWSQMVPITLNEEAAELLVEQDYALTDIPADGSFVRLRRSANTSAGGQPFDVSAKVHPDNAALAERVAQLFRLDIAGIDFICPDISRSWHEVGGVVCEVNGQPQFTLTRPDTPLAAISGLVKAKGRIPVVVILAPLRWGEWASNLQDSLHSQGITAGLSLPDDLWVAGKQQSQHSLPDNSRFADVLALQLNTTVQAMVISCDGKAWLKTGIPVDQIDLIISDKDTNAQVLTMVKAAGKPSCWHANLGLASAAENVPQSFKPLVNMIAKHVNTLINTPAEALKCNSGVRP